MKKGKRYLFLLVGLALLWIGLTVACETEPPVILKFSSSPAEISTGESATLSWVVKDATSVSINHGVGVVENVGNKKVSPPATITYTLIATNSGGAVAKSVVVIVSATSPPSPDTSPPVISGVDVSNITDSSARITWTTDEPATSQVEYGLTESYGSATPLDNNLIVSHGVTISGLSASTTYHFKVKSKDASGNETADTDRTFITSTAADTTPPVISAVNTSGATQSSITITWMTNEAATSQVVYGLTTSYGSTTPLDTNLVTSHSVTLSGLSASSTYHFNVKSKDASGNETVDADRTFTTSATADTTPPVISAVNTSGTTQSSITITWTTNKAATSQVMYGATTSYGSTTTLDTNLVASHSVTLSGLSAGTTYHFKVKSKDASGNETTDSDRTFATSTTADATAPVISAVSTSGATSSSVIITWTTNEPATSQVMYGATTSYGSTTPLDTNLVTSHSVTLSGLNASSTYHFNVKSKDASGNEAVSGDNTLAISEAATEVGGIISTNTIWTEQDSPYLATSTIQIAAGVTLTIEPGVSVTAMNTGYGNMFLIHGTLLAHGTADKRITLDGGMHPFFSCQNAGNNATVDLDYCIIKNGAGLMNFVKVFYLRHSEITNLIDSSDITFDLTQDAYIEYNRFTNVRGFATGGGHNVYIQYNLFDMQNHAGWLLINRAGPPTIVKYNSFINAAGTVLMLQGGRGSDGMVATENYWGTQDTAAIDAMIYDKKDDISLSSYIEYLPILTEPHPSTPHP